MQLNNIFSAMESFPNSILTATDVHGEDVKVTFPELIQAVDELASTLRAAGFKPGFRVGMNLGNCYEFVLWDLAIIRLSGVSQVFPEGYQPTTEEWQDTNIQLWVHSGSLVSPTEVNSATSVIDLSQKEYSSSLPSLSGEVQSYDEDLHSMVYSSGTSGYLKGLSISRLGTEKLLTDFLKSFPITPKDAHLIFLPLSNYQQRLSVWVCLHQGADIALTDYLGVFRELAVAKPTFIVAPPVIYENIYQLFSNMPDQREKVAAFLGGRMRFMITGMAPIKKRLLHAFNDELGIRLLEAYGVTETGMIAWNTTEYNKVGTVGQPVHADEVIITEEGELQIQRDYPLCKGYFQADPDDAARTFLSSGRIATGDMASMDDDGFITLKGRKKDIIVTNAGVKFHPEIVERKLDEVPFVAKAVVLWDDQAGQLYCVIRVVDNENPEVSETIVSGVKQYNENAESHMQIASLIIVTDEFTIESGLLTRNMKLNRNGFASTYLAKLRNQNLLAEVEEA